MVNIGYGVVVDFATMLKVALHQPLEALMNPDDPGTCPPGRSGRRTNHAVDSRCRSSPNNDPECAHLILPSLSCPQRSLQLLRSPEDETLRRTPQAVGPQIA